MPDAEIEERVGVRREPDTALVVARTPPSRAAYHRLDNPVFEQALRRLCGQPDVV